MASSPSGLADIINGCYAKMKDFPRDNDGNEIEGNYWYGRQFFQMSDFASDDVTYASKTPDDLNFAFCYDERTAGITSFQTFWEYSYQIIYSANVALDLCDRKIEAGNELTEEEIYLKGEALFLKAFIMHSLVRFYARPYTYDQSTPQQNLGIILRNNLEDKGPKARVTVAETYDAILKCLEEAIENFGRGASIRSSDKGLASLGAAKALLSRVYLYMGDWDKAIEASTDVINDFSYELERAEDMPTYYTETYARKETIWCLRMLTSDRVGNGSCAVAGMIYNGDGCWSEEGYSPDLLETMGIKDVVHDYANVDVRFSFANADVDKKGLKYKSCNKFSEQDGIPTLCSSAFFRLSEMYLNRAEAYAHKGDITSALKDVNTIRDRRMIPAAGKELSFYHMTENDITTDIVDLVLDETRREFCFEAHRVFDLLRNNKDIVRNYWGFHTDYKGAGTVDTENTKPGLEAKGVVTSHTYEKLVYPIPTQEIVNNPLCTNQQNPGY